MSLALKRCELRAIQALEMLAAWLAIRKIAGPVGKNAKLQMALKDLDGKKVTVQGTLERRSGVEIKERWIVIVSDLQAAVEGSIGR